MAAVGVLLSETAEDGVAPPATTTGVAPPAKDTGVEPPANVRGVTALLMMTIGRPGWLREAADTSTPSTRPYLPAPGPSGPLKPPRDILRLDMGDAMEYGSGAETARRELIQTR